MTWSRHGVEVRDHQHLVVGASFMIRVLVAKNEFLRRFGVATHHAVEMVVRGPRRIFAVDSAVVMNFISTSSTSGLSSVASSIDIINYLHTSALVCESISVSVSFLGFSVDGFFHERTNRAHRSKPPGVPQNMLKASSKCA